MNHPGFLLLHAGRQEKGSERETNGKSAGEGWKAEGGRGRGGRSHASPGLWLP